MFTQKIPMLLAGALLAFGSLVHAPAYSATATLSQDEIDDLTFMREEEKLARDTYLTFYEQYDLLTVFSNIASSEQKHMNAMLKLLKKYDLPDPAAGNEIGEFTNAILQALYGELIAKGEVDAIEALKVGGLIEEKDMHDIDAAIERSQQDDIDAVYATLLCGSRNHLRAFAQNIETLTQKAYVAQLLTQEEVDAILEAPMEKCNSKNAVDGHAVNTCRGKCLGLTK